MTNLVQPPGEAGGASAKPRGDGTAGFGAITDCPFRRYRL